MRGSQLATAEPDVTLRRLEFTLSESDSEFESELKLEATLNFGAASADVMYSHNEDEKDEEEDEDNELPSELKPIVAPTASVSALQPMVLLCSS